MNSPVAKTHPPRALPRRVPRVCVAVAASNATEMLERAEAIVRDHPFLELRRSSPIFEPLEDVGDCDNTVISRDFYRI